VAIGTSTRIQLLPVYGVKNRRKKRDRKVVARDTKKGKENRGGPLNGNQDVVTSEQDGGQMERTPPGKEPPKYLRPCR